MAALSEHVIYHESATKMAGSLHWLRCTCGWRLDPAPRNPLERNKLADEHIASQER